MKMITWLAAAALVIVLLAVIVEHLKRSSLFFPDRYPAGDWDFSSLVFRPIEQWIVAPDGTRLHALWFDAGPGTPALIWFHGNAGNVSTRAPVAAMFARHGMSVLLFDYRGYGRSDGRPTEHGAATDSIAAYDHVATALRKPSGSIVLFGESLGGAYAAWVAAHRPSCCAVIESSFPSLSRLARHYYPGMPFSLFVKRSLRTVDWLNQSRIPVLVIHGDQDEVIPYRLGAELFKRLETPKELWTVPGAMHNDIPDVAGEEYYERIRRFVVAGRAL